MEFSRSSLLNHAARAVGRGVIEALRSMGAGFAQANEGEADLQLGGAIAMGSQSAKEVAEQICNVPDAIPMHWPHEKPLRKKR